MRSMTPASGTKGTACVASIMTRALWRSAASVMAARSAILPVCIWTRLNATRVVAGPTESASSSNGTSRTVAPRSFATRIGNRLDVNSSAGTTTSSLGPSVPATSPVPTDAAGMVAIVSSDAPMSCAKSRGAESLGASQSVTQSPVPACHMRVARSRASTVACGGNPYVALSRYVIPGAGWNWARMAARSTVPIAVPVRPALTPTPSSRR
jgi:hypothetical protein